MKTRYTWFAMSSDLLECSIFTGDNNCKNTRGEGRVLMHDKKGYPNPRKGLKVTLSFLFLCVSRKCQLWSMLSWRSITIIVAQVAHSWKLFYKVCIDVVDGRIYSTEQHTFFSFIFSILIAHSSSFVTLWK